MENFADKAVDMLIHAGGKIILALLVFIIGRLVIRLILKFFGKASFMEKLDPTVKGFLMNFIRIGLYVILVISIISVLGVPMASLVAVLASCGVAIGLALQGALGNLAGGIMLLIFRPFNVGDYISAGGEEGVVREVSMFYTVLNTVDNRRVTIPNGTLMNANVSNYTVEDTRRVDLTFNVGAGNDVSRVQEVILNVLKANPDVISTPEEPFAAPLEGVPGGLKYTVRAWTTPDKYWDVYFALMKDVASALGDAGIGGPLTGIRVVEK